MEVSSVMLVQTAVGGWLVARTQACDHAFEEAASQTPRENAFSPVVSQAARGDSYHTYFTGQTS